MLFRMGLLAWVIWFFWLSITSAMSLTINLQGITSLWNQITKKIVPIHFVDNWNDFGWFLYVSDWFAPVETFVVESEEEQKKLHANKWDFCIRTDEENKTYVKLVDYDENGIPSMDDWREVIDDEWDSEEEQIGEMFEVRLWEVDPDDPVKGKKNHIRECGTHVKWFYYNAERWDRLWPLDSEMVKYFSGTGALTGFEGWIYTLCRPWGYSEAIEACKDKYGNASDVDCESPEIESVCLDPESDAYKDCPLACRGNNYEWDNKQELKACIENADKNYAQDGYYGMVTREMLPDPAGEKETFTLVIGTKYDDNEDIGGWMPIHSDLELVPNFLLLDNKYPIWFVYDYNGWIWFVWCQIEDTKKSKKEVLQGLVWQQANLKGIFKVDAEGVVTLDGDEQRDYVNCKDIWMLGDSLIKLLVEWLVWMNRQTENLWIILNQTDKKMQYFSASDINNSTLLNYTRQRAETLCRGKFQSSSLSDILKPFEKSSVICLSGDLSAEQSLLIKNTNKTLILQWNMTIKPFTWGEATWSGYYDVFIYSWDLNIDESGADKFVFTKQWFIAEGVNLTGFMDEIKLAEINNNWEYTGNLSSFASFIRWNFIVNGKVKSTSADGKLHNKYFIHWKFTSRDSTEALKNMFVWRCTNGYVLKNSWVKDVSQWLYCPSSVYQSASLVVIDQNYQSPLYW